MPTKTPVVFIFLTPCVLRRWLASTFGYIVREHWQLDTFGHSGVNGALSVMSGMTSMFLSRVDTEVLGPAAFRLSLSQLCRRELSTDYSAAPQEMQMRKAKKQTEFLWRGSSAYGASSDIWTYSMNSGSQSVLICIRESAFIVSWDKDEETARLHWGGHSRHSLYLNTSLFCCSKARITIHTASLWGNSRISAHSRSG